MLGVANAGNVIYWGDVGLSVRFWPILLKKSAVFFKTEKHASENEILNVRKAFQVEISRRCVLKRRFH